MHVRRLFPAALLLASGCATHTPLTECPTPEAQAAAAPAQQGTAPAPTAEPAQVAQATPAEPAQVAQATPAEPAQVAPAAPVAKQFHPDDLVCRTYEVTGSRVQQRRICKTRQQWIDDAREAREQLKKLQEENAAQGRGLDGPGN